MSDKSIILYWIRRDLRVSDNPALTDALKTGAEVIPVFKYDDWLTQLGEAPKYRLEKSLESLQKRYADLGSYVIIRKGAAVTVLRELINETGATSVIWLSLIHI